MRENNFGFSLVEMLVGMGVVAALVCVGQAAFSSALHAARTTECLSKLRTIGQAIHLYAQDNDDRFPRSSHSAGANREPGWAASISPYLSAGAAKSSGTWSNAFEKYFRCPEDRKSSSKFEANNPNVLMGSAAIKYSYALNVHFELNPNGDDYIGSPASWRKRMQVPKPARTILVGEARPGSYSDHFMCHQWQGAAAAKNAVAFKQHLGRSNFLFVDGHVETLRVEDTIDMGRNLNLWNPSVAN